MIPGEFTEFLLRLFSAALLGGVVGLERDIHGRDAGLRTHLLVSLGAALFMVLSHVAARATESSGYISDPTRIAAQIVTGIGFLGAGVIIKAGVNVRGLTTAASLWTVAAIGMACGGGYYLLSVSTTAMALGGLILLKQVEKIYVRDAYRNLSITTPIAIDSKLITDAVRQKELTIVSCHIEKNYELETMVTHMVLLIRKRGNVDKLAQGVIDSLESSSLNLKKVRWG